MNEYKTYSDYQNYQKYLFHHHGLSVRGLARRENLNPHTLHTVLRRFWGTDKKPQEKSQAEKYLQIAEKYLPEGENHVSQISLGERNLPEKNAENGE